MAYLVYFQQECGVRAAVEALCCKQFRYSLMGRTLIWYDNFAWGSIPTWGAMVVAFLQEFGARKPLKDGIFQIMNGVTPMMIGTSNLNNTDGSHTSSVSGDVGSAAPDGRTSKVDEFFEGRV